MAPLSEKDLVERIRYNALLGLLECAECVVDEPLDAEVNWSVVKTNLKTLLTLKQLFPGMCLNYAPPAFDPFPCDDCSCEEEAEVVPGTIEQKQDEQLKEYLDALFPRIYFYSND